MDIPMTCPECGSQIFRIEFAKDEAILVPAGRVRITCGKCEFEWDGEMTIHHGSVKKK
jgi:ribosomal protein S27AE